MSMVVTILDEQGRNEEGQVWDEVDNILFYPKSGNTVNNIVKFPYHSKNFKIYTCFDYIFIVLFKCRPHIISQTSAVLHKHRTTVINEFKDGYSIVGRENPLSETTVLCF